MKIKILLEDINYIINPKCLPPCQIPTEAKKKWMQTCRILSAAN